MAGLWSVLQAAGAGTVITVIGIGVLLLGVHALNTQALESKISEFEIRVRILGLHVRWSKNTSQADKGIDPPPAQGADSPADTPDKNGGAAKT